MGKKIKGGDNDLDVTSYHRQCSDPGVSEKEKKKKKKKQKNPKKKTEAPTSP